MLLNLPSTIILNLFSHRLESFLKGLFDCKHIAISPILEHKTGQQSFQHAINIKTPIHEFTVLISYNGFTGEEIEACEEYLKKNSNNTGIAAKLLFKKEIVYRLFDSVQEKDESSHYYEIALSIRTGGRDCMIHIVFPFVLFRIVLPSMREDTLVPGIEKKIIEHFKNPALLIPDTRTILETLGDRELAMLFNRLQSGNMLSVYQLVLLIITFPDLSLKIKKCLSQNTINDIINLKKNIERYRINKRDVLGCLYSIEEAIFMLIKSGFSFGFSWYLSEVESMIKNILGMDVLLSKDFISWIEEMADAGLLYEVVCRCNEETFAIAIMHDRESLIPILHRAVSEKKIDSITGLLKDNSDYSSVFEARLKIISTYRSIKMKKIHQAHESLDYLLARFKNDQDYFFVLLAVGWFVMSTALKGANRKTAQRSMKKLPDGARFLMEDILKGTVNPNILHDDMQINRAKNLCVKAIHSLYEEGIIALEE